MNDFMPQPIAMVGISAIMPDAPDAEAFWANISGGRYCISDVPKDRWDPEVYYDADPRAPYKTYSRIGGWVREFPWEPMAWRLPVPPTVASQLDDGQKWAVAAARAALLDAGWPGWDVDPERVAVIIGNAIGGEKHYQTNLHIEFPEFARSLNAAPSFAALAEPVRAAVLAQTRRSFDAGFPGITEDTMPGELANIIAGRVANLFNLRGPNFTTDAACASGLAAMLAAVRGLQARDYDAVIAGGVDRNMSVSAFVKFCKIGALSATGTRPFDADADGFVMGEGAALFVLKRLADAERAGDRIYAVLLGIAGSSDGRGKGITAPNPVGQRLAVERAWQSAGIDPATASYVEAHGTSTRVGDAAELSSLTEVFGRAGAAAGSIALGSVKSNIGHLKAAAGAAGLFKMAMSLHEKVLAPSLGFVTPNPNVDWAATPFRVNTERREWPTPPTGGVRSGGVSAFGFGGTNFHAVLEEYVPGRHRPEGGSRSFAVAKIPVPQVSTATTPAVPARGAAVVGGRDDAEVTTQLEQVRTAAEAGQVPTPSRPDSRLADAAVRVAIDYADATDLAAKAEKALQAMRAGNPAVWRLLRAQGVFRGRGPAPKVAFLYTGQGSQYVNMLRPLLDREPIVAEAFAEADRVMTPLLGRPLTSYIFVDANDEAAVREAEHQLMQTEITQPAVLTVDAALTRMLTAHGVEPDMVMGHSLGEYAALVATGSLSFGAALEAVSARGSEMAHLQVADRGAMAAVFGPLEEIERIVTESDGYVIVANVNSTNQAVVGGATAAVERTIEALQAAGLTARRIPVSHAFHTSIVAPASTPLMDTLRRLDVRPPTRPIVANVTGTFYPADSDVDTMVDLLGRQVAAPVQFVAGLRTLYEAGARVFVEVGPKKALHGFVEDVLGSAHDDVLALFTNHPKLDDQAAFNQALCGLYAAGLGYRTPSTPPVPGVPSRPVAPPAARAIPAPPTTTARTTMTSDRYAELGRLFANVLDQGLRIYRDETDGRLGDPATTTRAAIGPVPATAEPVVITGAALGLPGVEHVFDDANVARILDGQQFIDAIPHKIRRAMVDHHITRLVKRESGDPTFETIDQEADVIKLAGRAAPFDPVEEFGLDPDRDAALDTTTRLAIGAGFDALRDAGIPLMMHKKTTTLGTTLPDRWGLPESMRDDTGVIFASAFPGFNNFAQDLERYFTDRGRREQLLALESVRSRMSGDDPATAEVDRRIADLRGAEPYVFDRRFLFRCLSMGHSQFAEIIGARGPNTQINAACASTTQALCLAEDWIRAGRARRVIVVSADDVTSESMLPWVGSGFLASGAAATDDLVEEAATPFDRRRHGMIVGMGAAALVVESAEAARERGVQPICELLGAAIANSAFHGTRLDVSHIGQVMEGVIGQAEARGFERHTMAAETMFVSHETYTPARGGSAAAEINALRRAFGPDADSVIITNTKGYTGHAMGAGVEDVVAVKGLETGIVPPVPNFKEPDPELGPLNLSTGGAYPVRYALRLAAGFGSQVAMALLRWTPPPDGARRPPSRLGYAYRISDATTWQRWLDTVSGQPGARLEVVRRRLRIVDGTSPVRVSAPPEPSAVEAAVAAEPALVTPGPITEPGPETVPVTVAGPNAADPAAEQVVEIVAGLTGYPSELLDLDLDLEADLGVDTVKQAEIFAAVRERFGVARDESLRLRDFPTLAHVIAWIRERTATTPAPTLPAPTESAPAAPDEVARAVVGIVATLTGYPSELLEVDLDLEADLGVDTVKQAEIFAAVRERFGVARDESLRLRDFPTLAHVIAWIRERTAATPAPTRIAPGAAETAEIIRTTVAAVGDITGTDRVPRRVPIAVVRPDLSLCETTGVQIGAGSRIVVMLDEGGVGESLVTRLRRLGAQVLTVAPGTATDQVVAQIDGWRGDAAVQGVYWLAALDDEGPIEALDLAAWREALRRRVGALHATMRRLYDDGPFLVTGTRLGGRHGYDDAGATCPLGGAVTGFAKAYRKERPTLVKTVDFALGRRTATLANLLVDETLRDPGCVEVGYADGLRWGVALAQRPFGDGTDAVRLGPETVFLVTGAAGSIVSAITADLAVASHGMFHLLDITPMPDPTDPDLRAYLADRQAFTLDLAARLRERGERPTPVAIEKELARFERLHAALAAVQAIENAGGTAHYHCVDLTDADAVAKTLAEVRGTNAGIDVLLHAAGLEISHALPDKDDREFDLVFGVKADGWFNVLRGVDDLEVGASVVFSSVAGRFGNAGQADYGAANDLLCKITSNYRRTHPGTRAIALDWTAWDGIGMASRGSIPKIMESAGVEMLAPEVGVPWVRRELTAGPGRGEVVVAGALGLMATEYHPRGGLAETALATLRGPMLGEIVAASVHSGLLLRTTLDPVTQPFLNDHRIDGTSVLPGVMGIEAFAEAARWLAPDWWLDGVEKVDFRSPVKFYRDEPRTLVVTALLRPDSGDLVAECTLAAERSLPGTNAPQQTVHFTGAVRLKRRPPVAETGPVPGPDGSTLPREDIYRIYFHGPAYQVISSAWPEGEGAAGRLTAGLPADHDPTAGTTVLGPRLVELFFQTAGLWEAGMHGRLALPLHVGRVRVLAEPTESSSMVAVARPSSDGFAGEVLDAEGRVILRVDDYRTVALPESIPGEVQATIRKALGG